MPLVNTTPPSLWNWGVRLGDRHRGGRDLVWPTMHPLVGGALPQFWCPSREWITEQFATRANHCPSAPNSPGSGHATSSNIFVVLQPIRTQTPALGLRFPTHVVTNVAGATRHLVASHLGAGRFVHCRIVCHQFANHPPPPGSGPSQKWGPRGSLRSGQRCPPEGSLPRESTRPFQLKVVGRDRAQLFLPYTIPLRVDNTQVHI